MRDTASTAARTLEIFTLLLAFVSFGCAADQRMTYEFRFINSQTHMPMPDVQVTYFGFGVHHKNRAFPAHEQMDFGLSDSEGVTVAPGILSPDASFQHSFFFEKPGFARCLMRDVPPSWRLFYINSKTSWEERAGHEGEPLPLGHSQYEIMMDPLTQPATSSP